MTEISNRLKLIVTLLPLRFPIAELATSTGYSKGTISNYLSGKQAASGRFLKSVISTYNQEIDSFEFKKRMIDSIEHYIDINKKEISEFFESIGYDADEDFSITNLQNLNTFEIVELINKISFSIPNFEQFINNNTRADIKGLKVNQLTKLERTVFLKKEDLSEEDMIFFVKVIRKHRESLLYYPLFQKLVRALAFTLEIDHEIELFKDV